MTKKHPVLKEIYCSCAAIYNDVFFPKKMWNS